MLHRLVAGGLVAVMLATAVPCQAQVEPSLPSWNWDNPKGDPLPWAPSSATFIELAALGLAVDLFFGGRVSGAIYRGAVVMGRNLFGSRAPATAVRAVAVP